VDPFSWKIAPKAFFMKAVVTPPATTFAVLQINCSVPVLQFLDIAVLTLMKLSSETNIIYASQDTTL